MDKSSDTSIKLYSLVVLLVRINFFQFVACLPVCINNVIV